MIRLAWYIVMLFIMCGCHLNNTQEAAWASTELPELHYKHISICGLDMTLEADTGETLRMNVGYSRIMEENVDSAFWDSVVMGGSIEARWLVAYVCNAAVLYANVGVHTSGVSIVVHPEDMWLIDMNYKWFPDWGESGKRAQWCPSSFAVKTEGKIYSYLPGPVVPTCDKWVVFDAESWHIFYYKLDHIVDMTGMFSDHAAETICDDNK